MKDTSTVTPEMHRMLRADKHLARNVLKLLHKKNGHQEKDFDYSIILLECGGEAVVHVVSMIINIYKDIQTLSDELLQ